MGTQISIDRELTNRLSLVEDLAELRNDQGQLVGIFLTSDSYKQAMYRWANALVSEQQLSKAAAEPGIMTTQQAVEWLQKLDG